MRPLLMAHIAVFFMSMAGVLAGHSGFSPWESTFYRVSLGALVLLGSWMFVPKKTKMPFSIILLAFFLGALLGFHWFAFFKSIELLGVTLGSALIGSEPLIVAAFAMIFLKEKLSGKVILAMGISSVGFVMLLLVSDTQSEGLVAGCAWAIGGYIVFAILVIINRRLVQSYPPLLVTGIEMLGATPVSFFYSDGNLWPVTAASWFFAISLGFLCTGLAYYLYNSSMKQLPANLAGALLALEVAYGMAAGWILGDSLTILQAGAAVLIANILFLDIFELLLLRKNSQTP